MGQSLGERCDIRANDHDKVQDSNTNDDRCSQCAHAMLLKVDDDL
jgi:hypothetical protein